MSATLADIRDFLALHRIALVGASRDPRDFSRYLFHEMSVRGYDMVPVNPAVDELEQKRCFARVQDIDPPVEGALLLTPARDTERVVRDCAEAGIRHIWMHRGGGAGSVSPEAREFCRKSQMRVVEGCPLMFLPGTAFFHRVHGFLLRLTGSYPKQAERAA